MDVMQRIMSAAVLAGAVTVGSLAIQPGVAIADPLESTGTISVVIPESGSGVPFTVTILDQRIDNETIDNTHGGILTLGWTGAQEAPQTSEAQCAADGIGGGLVIEGTTPGMSIWASYASGTDRKVLGPFEISAHDTDAIASVCTEGADGSQSSDTDEPVEDPDDDPVVEDPVGGGDPAEQDPGDEGEHGKPDKDKEKKDKEKKSKP
jgi:hypothetical protein